MAAFLDREAEVADSGSDDDEEEEDDKRKSSKRKHNKEKSASKKAKTDAKKDDGDKSDAESSSSGSSSSGSSSSSSSSDSDSEIENSEDEPVDNEDQLRKEMAGFVVENEDEEEDDAVGAAKAPKQKSVEDNEEEEEEDQPQKEVEDELEEDDYELINENLGVKNKPRRIRIEDDSDEEDQMGGNENRGDADDEAPSPDALHAGQRERSGKKLSRHDSAMSGDRDISRGGGDETNDDGQSDAEDEDDEDNFIVDDQGNPMKLKLGGKGMSGWQHQSLQEAQEIFGLDFDVEDLEAWPDSDIRGTDDLEAGEDEFEDNYEYDDEEYGVRHRRKPRKDLTQLYEAAELERNYLTPRDEKIRKEDVPERFLTRRVPVVPLIKSDDPASFSVDEINAAKDAEAEWIYNTLHTQATKPMLLVSESREVRPILRNAANSDDRDKLIRIIRNVVGFVREERLEVPFISAYRKELIGTLRDEDLWYIYDLDEQYTILTQRRDTLQRLMRTMQEFLKSEITLAESSYTRTDENLMASKLPPITDEMVNDVGGVHTIEELQDYYRYFMAYYGDNLNRARTFKANEKLRASSATQLAEITHAEDAASEPTSAVVPALSVANVVIKQELIDDKKSIVLLAKVKKERFDTAEEEAMESVEENSAESDPASSQLVLSDGNVAPADAVAAPAADASADNTTVTLTAPASPASPVASAAAAPANGTANSTSPSRNNNRRRAVIDEDEDDNADGAGDKENNISTAVVKLEKKEKLRSGGDFDDEDDDDDYDPEGESAKKLAKKTAALSLDEDAEATSVATPASSQIVAPHQMPTRRDSYLQTFIRQRIDEFVLHHFGIDLLQFAVGVSGGQARNVLKHQEYTDPDEVAKKYVGTHYQTSKQVKKAGVMLMALRMANFPQLRSAVRKRYFLHAKISVRPTTQGVRDIDEQHNCYRVKYLTNKSLSKLLPQDFAAIHAAAQTGLLRYKLALDNVESLSGDPKVPPKMVTADNRQLRTLSGVGGINTHSLPQPTKSELLPHAAAGAAGGRDGGLHHTKITSSTPFIVTIKDHLLKDEYREEVQNWNKLRVLALQVALDDHLYPQFEKELESRLLREANDMILRKIYAEVENVVMMKPFRPAMTSKSNSNNQLSTQLGTTSSIDSIQSRPHNNKSKLNASDMHVDLDARPMDDDQSVHNHNDDMDASHAEIDIDDTEWTLGENDKNLRIMGISWDKTVNESGGAHAVVINRWGEVLIHVPLRRFLISTDYKDAQMKQEDLSDIDRLVHEWKPQCVAIMGGGLECERLQDDFKQMFHSMKAINPGFPLSVNNVVIVDPSTAQKFQTSLEWKRRFKEPSPMFLSALGVARRLLDPVLAYAQLCTFEEDILNVIFHPMQKQMPHDDVRDAILRPIMGVVNYLGVDFNEVIDHQETLMPLVQFVCGLGPRRGPHVIKMIMRNAKSGHINNREQLKMPIGGVSDIIFRNMAGFVRFTRGTHEHEQGDEVNDYWYALDKTRIHPDNDAWVRKIAADALDKEEDDATDEKQLLEEVMLPENADALGQLDLDSFADYLSEEYGEKKITLHLIREELIKPYFDRRRDYKPVDERTLFSIVVGEPAELYDRGRLVKVSVVNRNPISYKRPKPLSSTKGDSAELNDLPSHYQPTRNAKGVYHCSLCRKMLGENPGEAVRHALSAFNMRPFSNYRDHGKTAANVDDCPGEARWVTARFDSGLIGRIYVDCISSKGAEKHVPIDMLVKSNQVLMCRIMRTTFYERLRGYACMLTTRSTDLAGPKLRITSEIEQEMSSKQSGSYRPSHPSDPDEIYNPILADRDRDYDEEVERAEKAKLNAKHALSVQAAKARKLTHRVITHPNFKNIDFAQCEKLMESMDAGECVFRPSSKGYEHLTLSCKLLPQVVLHVDIQEKDKKNAFSLGKRLIIDVGNSGGVQRCEEFEDLDEIKARFVDVIASNVREVTTHQYYFFKPKPPPNSSDAEIAAVNAEPPCYADVIRVIKYLTDEKERQPARIPYCMSPSRENPGHFMLAYKRSLNRPPCIEWFKVTFDGFVYRQKTLSSVMSMLTYFKDHCHEPPPRNSSQGTPQSSFPAHMHHNEALNGALANGLLSSLQMLAGAAGHGTPYFGAEAGALLRTPVAANLLRTPGGGGGGDASRHGPTPNAAGGIARIGGAAAAGPSGAGTVLSSDVMHTLSKLTPLAAASFQMGGAHGNFGASPAVGGHSRMTPSLLGAAPNNPMASPYAVGGSGVRRSGGTPQSIAGSYAPSSVAVGGAGNAWNQAFQFYEREAEGGVAGGGGGGAGHGDYGERRTPRSGNSNSRDYGSRGGDSGRHSQPYDQRQPTSRANDYSSSQPMMPPPPPGLPAPASRDSNRDSRNMMPPPVPPYHGSSRRRY